MPFSRCLSATGIRFLGIPVPPGNSAFLTVGLPNTTACPDPFGFSTFRTSQIRRVGRPLHPGTAVFTRLAGRHQSAPAASQRPVLDPSSTTHPRGCK